MFRTTPHYSRRQMLQASGLGFGSLALAGLLRDAGLLASDSNVDQSVPKDLKPRSGHSDGRAKAVIQLFQNGGPSQMDLFDPKPELTKRDGQPHPGEVETFQLGNKNVLMKSPFKFSQHGECGHGLRRNRAAHGVGGGRLVHDPDDAHAQQQPSVRHQLVSDR